jgi:hypothetical protein
MCYGIDSGSKKTLSFIRKNIEHGILYQRVVETADNGIIPTLSYVIGFPVEEKGDIDETLWLALRAGIVGNNNPLIQLPTVLPGTGLHEQYGDRLVREVDTYFALGLEFDRGRRLGSDEEIINSDPKIYSSFYNLPCPGRSLDELNLIASHFPLMVRFYPKSFLLLSLEFGESVSDLFLRWLHWLQGHVGRRGLTLSPQDCFLHFREFVSDSLKKQGKMVRKHFPDVLKYENTALEVGKFGPEKSAFHMDLSRIRECKPIKSEKIIIEKFDFDLPGVILDLKSGEFKESYPDQETLLVFTQDDDLLDVSEINAFAKDFLILCDGEKTVQGISQELYKQYGQGMKPEDFLDGCMKAVQVLGKKRFIESK